MSSSSDSAQYQRGKNDNCGITALQDNCKCNFRFPNANRMIDGWRRRYLTDGGQQTVRSAFYNYFVLGAVLVQFVEDLGSILEQQTDRQNQRVRQKWDLARVCVAGETAEKRKQPS